MAGEREAQAPATRAWRLPVVVRPPWRRRSPVAYADGVKPREGISGRGGANRGRAPRAAPVVTATGHGPPAASLGRVDHRGQAPGRPLVSAGVCQTRPPFGGRSDCAEVCLAPTRRRRGGPDDLAAPAAVGRPPGGAAGERLACRRSKAWSRHCAGLRSWRASARARPRSRLASSSTAGTSTGGRSPERSRRVCVRASRRWVVTRSPGLWGIKEGATPQQPWPFGVRERSGQEPPGPASETKTRGGCWPAGDGAVYR